MLLVNLLRTKLIYKTNNLTFTVLLIHAIQDVNHSAGYKRESHETWDMGGRKRPTSFPAIPTNKSQPEIPARVRL